MADNVELDPGTGGAVVSTEEVTTLNGGVVSAQHVQRVATALRTADGTAVDLPGDSTNGLDVDVTRLPSGSIAATTAATGGGVESGALRVTVASDSTGVLSVDDNGGSLTVDNAALSVTGGGVEASALRVTLANDSTGVVSVDDNGASLTVDVGAALPAGDNNIGNFDLASAIPAGTNNIGDVDVASIAAGSNTIGNVGVIPRTSGGLSIHRSLDVDETEEEIKATAGQVFGWYFYNDGAAEAYVKFYNATAANVTVGTTTPVLTIPIPAGAAANVFSSIGVAFGTAICVAATTGVADADTTAPAANQVVGNVFYS